MKRRDFELLWKVYHATHNRDDFITTAKKYAFKVDDVALAFIWEAFDVAVDMTGARLR